MQIDQFRYNEALGKNYTNSQESRAEVYCFKLNFNISTWPISRPFDCESLVLYVKTFKNSAHGATVADLRNRNMVSSGMLFMLCTF